MALLNKIRKDIKKSSYYVWFLGAQESKGLRGSEYIIPVLKNLVLREKTVEPFKITLQVSQKGLKIVQNLNNVSVGKKLDFKPNKNDVIKHVIPHHAVTSVYQKDDVVACVLLLYNPVTRCPVHVHAYRCDTIETASLLTQQLSALVDKPENQRKMNEIEARLHAKGLLPTVPRVNIPKRVNSSGSDGLSTTSPASESSGGSSSGGQERLSHLYDSLAAELREKIGMSTDGRGAHAPILLPPRDYDTVHRQKGNLTGIELRRCLNENIIGAKSEFKAEKKFLKSSRLSRVMGSSGGSSGIGSDHPSSPDGTSRSQNLNDVPIFNHGQGNFPSDDEWTEPSRKSSAGPSSRQQVNAAPQPVKKISAFRTDAPFKKCDPNRNDVINQDVMMDDNRIPPNLRIENFRKLNEKGSLSPVGVVAPRRRTSENAIIQDDENYKKRIPGYKEKSKEKETSQISGTLKLSPQERFLDAKTKFLLLEKERLQDQEKIFEKKKHSTAEVPISPEIIQTRPHRSKEERIISDRGLPRRNSFFDDEPTGVVGKISEDVDKRQRISRSDSCAALLLYQSQQTRDVDDRRKSRKSAEFTGYYDNRKPEETSAYDKNNEIQQSVNRGDSEIRRRLSHERRSSNFEAGAGEVASDEENNSHWFQHSPKRHNGCEIRGRHLSPLRAIPRQKKHSEENVCVPYEREMKNKPSRFEHKIKNPFSSHAMKDSKRTSYKDEHVSKEMSKSQVFGDCKYQEKRGMGAYRANSSEYDDDDDHRRKERLLNYQHPRLRRNPSAGYNRESEFLEQDAFHNSSYDIESPRPSQMRIEKLPARYRHSFVDLGSANGRLHPHDVVQRTNSTVSSARVGIAAVHLY